jgi:hypothetical protein
MRQHSRHLERGGSEPGTSSVGTKRTVVDVGVVPVVGVVSSVDVLVEVVVLVSVEMFVDFLALVVMLIILTRAVLVRVAWGGIFDMRCCLVLDSCSRDICCLALRIWCRFLGWRGHHVGESMNVGSVAGIGLLLLRILRLVFPSFILMVTNGGADTCTLGHWDYGWIVAGRCKLTARIPRGTERMKS